MADTMTDGLILSLQPLNMPLQHLCKKLGIEEYAFPGSIQAIAVTSKKVTVEIEAEKEQKNEERISFLETAFASYFQLPVNLVFLRTPLETPLPANFLPAEETMVARVEVKTVAEPKKIENHIELHNHSQLSAMDSILPLKELVERAHLWGQKALGITDHEVVQAFPDFYELCKAKNIKPIFGMEGNLVDLTPILYNIEKVFPDSQKDFLKSSLIKHDFCVVDFETTGLSPLRDEIIEIGAVKILDGKEAESFRTFVRSIGHGIGHTSTALSPITTSITGITDEMLVNAPALAQAIPQLLDFLSDSIIIGHNVNFDYQFLLQAMKKTRLPERDWVILDTLALSRSLLQMKSYTLDKVVKKLEIDEFDHHRAEADARVTGKVFLRLIEMAKKSGRTTIEEIQSLQSDISLTTLHGDCFTVYVQNKVGLKNLYRLVSLSHLEFLGKLPGKGSPCPLIPKNKLQEHREGLLIGTGSPVSELSKAFRFGKEKQELLEIARFYDFIEIMPADAFTDVEDGLDVKTLKEMYRQFFQIGEEAGIPVLMTSNVHYLDTADHKAWSVLKISDYALHRRGQELSKNMFDAVKLQYRTTQELLTVAEEMLGSAEFAQKVVVESPLRFIEKIEEVQPITHVLHPPIIEGAEDEIRNLTMRNMTELYGNPPPVEVQRRVQRELDAIIGNGYAVLYLIAQKIVARSLQDGYLVGSRGSVGSSLVATLLEITEVNPLSPHYVCPNCKHCEFSADLSGTSAHDSEIDSGYDLPDRNCPSCGKKMRKYGQNIPFETFMGFKGNKIPDIDLNFSGEYQVKAHRCIEELFGSEYVFRAGTISTVAEKTAYGYVLRYEETTHEKLTETEKELIASKIAGVKRTTGQHPGGLMIVPKNMEVHDFTPVQRPANDTGSDIKTTHFDYNSIHEDLVKIDALGHDDPTFMRFLQDLTKVDPLKIPMDDKKIIEMFSGLRPLKIKKGEIPDVETSTLGIPEFGTNFVRGMLRDTKPKSFADLVRISGLSHGTDVWINNAKELIVPGKVPLSQVIACRDDIMIDLIERKLEPIQAFTIMERVRKGKGLSKEEETIMKEKGVPDWFIDSCKKIKYLFPKAHAVAYVSMAFRVAFFKLYYPLAFYSAFFSIRGGDFDISLVLSGGQKIRENLMTPYTEKSGNGESKSKMKHENEKFTHEVALEMILRGFGFLCVDLIKSHSYRFSIEGNSLRIPLTKVSGLGEKVALCIEQARDEKPFASIEDLKKRTSVSATCIETLKALGALGTLSDSAQYKLF